MLNGVPKMTTNIQTAVEVLNKPASREDILFVLDKVSSDFGLHIEQCQSNLNTNHAKVSKSVINKCKEIGLILSNVYLHLELAKANGRPYSEKTDKQVGVDLKSVQEKIFGTAILHARDKLSRLQGDIVKLVEITDTDELRKAVLSKVHEIQRHYEWTAEYSENETIKAKMVDNDDTYEADRLEFDVFEQSNPLVVLSQTLEMRYVNNRSNKEIQELVNKGQVNGYQIGRLLQLRLASFKENIDCAKVVHQSAVDHFKKGNDGKLESFATYIGNMRIKLIAAKFRDENLFDKIKEVNYQEIKTIEGQYLELYRGFCVDGAENAYKHLLALAEKEPTPREAVRIMKQVSKHTAVLKISRTKDEILNELQHLIATRSCYGSYEDVESCNDEIKNYLVACAS